eukprot:293954_1
MACCGLFGGSDKEINDANAAGDVSIPIHGADPDAVASHDPDFSANSESDILGWEQRIEKNLNLSEGNGKPVGVGIGLVCLVIVFLLVAWAVSGESSELAAKRADIARWQEVANKLDKMDWDRAADDVKNTANVLKGFR